MRRVWTATIFSWLCAAVLACPARDAPREEPAAARPDDAADAAVAATRDRAAAADSGGVRGVLALGTTWTALEQRGESLAIVEHCFGEVPSLTLALDSAPPRVHRIYGQDGEVFEVGDRQADDTLLLLQIRSRDYPAPGTLRLAVRDARRGVVEVTQEIAGQRRPSALFVGGRHAAGFRRVPRPADCGEP